MVGSHAGKQSGNAEVNSKIYLRLCTEIFRSILQMDVWGRRFFIEPEICIWLSEIHIRRGEML